MIKHYQKKPIKIEAVQFTRDNWNEIKTFTNNVAHTLLIPKCINCLAICTIDTLEGPMKATENDYIIKGINGEFYACKPDIFFKTYEELDE